MKFEVSVIAETKIRREIFLYALSFLLGLNFFDRWVVTFLGSTFSVIRSISRILLRSSF